MQEMRGSWWHGNRYQRNMECKDEGWNKGNRDKQRGVRDVTEIRWTWGQKRYSRGKWGRTDLSKIHQWSISNNTSNNNFTVLNTHTLSCRSSNFTLIHKCPSIITEITTKLNMYMNLHLNSNNWTHQQRLAIIPNQNMNLNTLSI